MAINAQNMTILVAGGAGFIGSHLCAALLKQGHRVICLDSMISGSPANVETLRQYRNFRLVEADVTDLPEMPGPLDRIYNLASPASPARYQADPVHTLLTNVLGTDNLVKLAMARGARFLQTSTSEVYGDPDVHPQPEDYWGHVNCTGTRACYDEGKRAAESLCFDYLRAGDADIRVARIFNTYGPHMRADDGRIVSNLICQALQDQPMTIYGDGTQTRSFCYVSDMVDGLLSLMERASPPDGPINLGNPGEFMILELAALIRQMVPTQSQLIHHPLPSDDPRKRQPDITRAREVLNWAPRINLNTGLTRTIPWFASQYRALCPVTAARTLTKLPAAE